LSNTYQNFIAGQWRAPASGEHFENRNPANTDELIGLFPETGPPSGAGGADIEAAVASAERGFEKWSRMPAPERGFVLKKAGDVMTERKDAIARDMTREMGKVLEETRGDVQEAIDTAYYAAVEGRRLFGKTVPSELRDKWAMSFRRPIGPFAIITPFNFPLAVPSWKIFPALLCGNSIIWKPSEDVPLTANTFTEILLESGLPPEAIQLVHGAGETVGKALVDHPEVPGISFTGSTRTGSAIGETAGRMHKRLSLEMGGKNAQIVMADADMDLALDGVIWGAFGTAGQRCTATSRLLLEDRIHDEFVARLQARAEALRLGDGLDSGTEVGPMIHPAAVEKCERYVGIARSQGATVACGGARATGPGLEKGHFFRPTVLTGVDRNHRTACEEIFGPVLSVIKFESLDEAIDINNQVEYGLSSALYTSDVRSAFRAINELDNGITYVNAPTIGAEAHLPFGGVKGTGNGHREGGWEVYEFYTETKVAYVDYSGKLQRAQIDVDW